MRVNVEWLRDWVDVDMDSARLGERLTTAGLEVDAILEAGPRLADLVVARIADVRRHPRADRLSVCEVDDGSHRYTVVCGAPNVAAGAMSVLAPVGSTLPSGVEVGPSEIRGVVSEGMLCSEAELGLGEDSSGLLILDDDAPVGAGLGAYLNMDDAVLDIDLTPNRGDCFSILGIAREIGALSKQPLKRQPVPSVSPTVDEQVNVALLAGESCPRFAGRVIRNVSVDARSPLWMRERLRRVGLRSIHPVVDVTNYVMLEIGQPLHAYDLAKLRGDIVARYATEGEKLVLLDGREVALEKDMLVIGDASGAIGLAGIMGGQSTAVDSSTVDIFLESAYFAPAAIAGRARRLGMQTDASQRFERGVDPRQQARAIERATSLLLEIAGGQAGPLSVSELRELVPVREEILLRRERLQSLLGITVHPSEIEEIFRSLEMRVRREGEAWKVTPPSFRFDLDLEEDLIEEVGRMVGYDRIPAVTGSVEGHLGFATEQRVREESIADRLAARGYAEVITYSFVDEQLERALNPDGFPLKLANPISRDMGVMRSSLWPGLLRTAELNVSRQRERLRLFEIGSQFSMHGDEIAEVPAVAGLGMGPLWPEQWDGAPRDVDYFDVKGDLESLLDLTGRADEITFEADTHPALRPGQTARLRLGSASVGWLGAIHPELQRRFEFNHRAILFSLQIEPVFAASLPAFREYSRFPIIRRDVAVVIDEQITADELLRHVREAAGGLLQNVVLFDIYRGGSIDTGRKSVALGLILQDTSRTLTDVDADQTVHSVTGHLERELGARIRTQ
jgi:phenylalanyl-tRNA synthetase beta chain